MARNRLTWQNVNAPDYGSSIRGVEAANRMFQNALGGLNTSLGSYITGQKEAQNEALLKQQEAAERGVRAQLASVLGDVDAQQRIIQEAGSNPNLRADFLKNITGTDYNTLLTGAESRQRYDQTGIENAITNRDQDARDAARVLYSEILRRGQLGDEQGVAQLQQEYQGLIAAMNQADQRDLFEGGMQQMSDRSNLTTAALGRDQTRQNMYQSGVRFRDQQTEVSNSRMADAAIAYALSSSPDIAGQRRAIVDFATKNGASPTAVLAAFDRHIQAAQNVGIGDSSSGGGGAGQSQGTPVQADMGTGTVLGNSPASEAERLLGEIRTRAAQNQVPVSDEMVRAGERNRPLAVHYEEAVKNFPETIGKLSSTEYNKLATDIKNKHSNLTWDQVALAIQQEFQMGQSNWESSPILTNTPITFIPSLIGSALFPDWGREAGVDTEGLERTAKAVGTPEGRNQAVTQQQAAANAERLLQEQLQRVAQAEQQAQQAQIHYQQWGNPAVLSDAERNLELEQGNLDSLLNDFRTDENLAEMFSPLFRDPENPGRTISIQQGRERAIAADEANMETAANRREAQAAIPTIESQLESLEAEYRNTPLGSPRRREIMTEIQGLRRRLREERRRAR